MSRHVWLNSRGFAASVLRDAATAWAVARRASTPLPEAAALQFTGYAIESIRQKGGVRVEGLWAGAVRSGHRYARGRNAGNYRAAGRKLILALLRRKIAAGVAEYPCGVPETVRDLYTACYDGDDDCLTVLHDALEEAGLHRAAAFLRGESLT